LADVGGIDQALVDAEGEDQTDFDDERDAEKERETAHPGVGAAFLERLVVEAVDRDAEQEERRHQRQPGENRVPAVISENVGAVGAEDHDRRMGDVGYVEQAECHRQADAHRGIETAEQDAEHNRLVQQLE
jgi:hypothetical protein